jgi:imidazolonepropionase
VPKDSSLVSYTDNIINEQIPEIIKQTKAGLVSPENIDVFHEKGVFETVETQRVLEAGLRAGLKLNFHGDELHPMNSAELACDVGAHAVSHLEEISDTGIQKMAEKSVFAILLPTTAYILRIKPPPARKMIESGI